VLHSDIEEFDRRPKALLLRVIATAEL